MNIRKLIGALILVPLVAAGAPAKDKKKAQERLKSIETLYVDGVGYAPRYVKENLGKKTCLRSVPEEADADAILDIQEQLGPCRDSMGKMCRMIEARITDRATGDVLWWRQDENMPGPLSLDTGDTAGKWILWGLQNSCCKGRSNGGSKKQ